MDLYVQKLSDNFLNHPVWVEAARSIKEGASSQVFFSHCQGEWHLLRKDGQSQLRQGPSPDPDFSFRFTPASIDRIFAVKANAGVGDFAVELFECITSEDPLYKIDFRVISPFSKLLSRGYVKLLLKGGPTVLAYAASHGVRTLADLRKLLKEARSSDPISALKKLEES